MSCLLSTANTLCTLKGCFAKTRLPWCLCSQPLRVAQPPCRGFDSSGCPGHPCLLICSSFLTQATNLGFRTKDSWRWLGNFLTTCEPTQGALYAACLVCCYLYSAWIFLNETVCWPGWDILSPHEFPAGPAFEGGLYLLSCAWLRPGKGSVDRYITLGMKEAGRIAEMLGSSSSSKSSQYLILSVY
jgi:hypothetical protein